MASGGIDVRNFEAFLAVIDHGGFSSAAIALGITQSAVSLRIKALEGALAIRLFERRGRIPRLTAQGQALVTHARTVLDLVQSTPAIVNGAIAGMLTVGAVPTAMLGLLPNALAGMRADFPDLRLRIVSGSSAQLAGQLATSAIDAALVTKPNAIPDGMAFSPIVSEPLKVLVPKDLVPAKDDANKTAEALSTLPYIWFNRDSWAGGQISAELERRNIRVNAVMEINSLEAVVAMVGAGLGASVAPIAVSGLPVSGNIEALDFDGDPPNRILGVLYSQQHTKERLIDALTNTLRKAGKTSGAALVMES